MSNGDTLKRLRVFVAWPLDVKEERNRAKSVISTLHQVYLQRGWYLEMIDWEDYVAPEAGVPENVILENTDPSSWDVFVGILWQRFGTSPQMVDPQTQQQFTSGFEVEYKKAHDLWQENGRPHIMLYRCTRPVSPNVDLEQLRLVQHFFQGIEKRYEVLYKEFNSPDDFADKLNKYLIAVIEKRIKPKPETRPVAFPHSRLFEDVAEATDFSNRVNELAEIQNQLSTDPEVSILVHAPAGMGKSRLVERLQKVVPSPSSGKTPLAFQYVQLEFHGDDKISTSKEEFSFAVHRQLPQPKAASATLPDLLQALRVQAVNLMGKNMRLIILLDRIELMSGECRTFLRRELLPELRRAVKEPAFYPAVIAFGRVHPKEWRGKDSVRFRTVELSPFGKAVIEEILRRKTDELNLNFPDSAYDEWAEKILNISHGHPRCIVNLVSWLYEQNFAPPTDFSSKETFLSFVVTVIEREILSEDNLAPLEPIDKKSAVANRLRQVLPYICVFRFYSRAQLRILNNCELINAEEIGELEEQLNRTFLIAHPTLKAWFEPHEIIRKLLADSLYHQNRERFIKINEATCRFYDDWITNPGGSQSTNLLGGTLQDHDLIDYIMEGLYHHSFASKWQKPAPILQDKLTSYLRCLRGHNPAKNLTRLLADRMLDDAELRQVIERQGKTNVHDELISIVTNWKD